MTDRMMQQEQKEKRRRTGHTNSHTGCYTCKYVYNTPGRAPSAHRCFAVAKRIAPNTLFHQEFSNTSPGFISRVRHKKCDETRPSCINCSSTGRKCDGYPQVQSPKGLRAVSGSGETQSSEGSENAKDLVLKSHVELPTAMVDPGKIGLSTHECYFLDFFRNVGAYDYAGYPVNNFIHGVVRQVGESQPSVKHAAMALTSISHTRAGYYFGVGSEKQKDFVLRQCSKAITHLLQQPKPKDLLSRRAHREVVMTMCGVLAQLARNHDDHETMKMHLMYGQRAMREWQDIDFDGSSIAPILSAVLADLNWRLQIASSPASFLQDDNPLLLDAPVLSNFNFSNIEYTVNGHWYWWSTFVLWDGKIPNHFRTRPGYPDGILISQNISFLFKVRIFTRQLKTCIDQVGIAPPQSIQGLLTALRLWDQVACAMVAAALADDKGAIFKPSQMKYDTVFAYFRRINEFGKKIVRSLIRQNAPMPTFPIDTAVGTPLFFCGSYCRDWAMRREALCLLKVLGERFKGSDAAGFLPMKISALERIIEIESHGLQREDVVPELARIQYVELIGRPGSANIRFSYRPVGMDGLVEVL